MGIEKWDVFRHEFKELMRVNGKDVEFYGGILSFLLWSHLRAPVILISKIRE